MSTTKNAYYVALKCKLLLNVTWVSNIGNTKAL